MSATTTNLKEAIVNRRSIRKVTKNDAITKERIEEVLKTALHAPTSFNTQSARIVVLLGEEHDKLWDITKETLRKIVPEENFAATEEKMNAFKAGYGTVLFFEDQATVEKLQENLALYKDNFPIWSQQASGMLQFAVWTALEAEGFGASLQHYNPIIDDEVKKEWKVPANWKLIAQMPFGKPNEQPAEKKFQPTEERVKFH
ncbi:nitroreductase [Bacillus anthracis]|nr:nitroreductase [Bacillus anthracis]KOS29341.1 nitroreductase [Bacillus anthracis]